MLYKNVLLSLILFLGAWNPILATHNPSTLVFSPVADSLVLVDLYNATTGASWTNTWDLSQPMSTWYGITLDGSDCVEAINLTSNNLVGTLPASITTLSNLRELILPYNQLSGSIPSNMGDLSNLYRLYLNNNQLTGTIPASLGSIVPLFQIDLSYNDLTGSIPMQLGSLNNLRLLGLGNNGLTGSIPPELGNMSVLFFLGLESNSLTGAIPSELGNLSFLLQFRVPNNNLTGSIPPELENLARVEMLSLSNNQLTGSIPLTLGNISSLRSFYANNNLLAGAIPSSLGDLANLEHLWLNDNQLADPIPASLGNLYQLRYLYLHNNFLKDDIPKELGNLSNIEFLYAHNNLLSGCFPAELAALCDPSITVNFSSNTSLPGSGDFAAFCAMGTGVCRSNEECVNAIMLPMNLDPCGRSSEQAVLNGANTSAFGPYGVECAPTFAGQDVWFSAVVPATGNLLIRNDAITNLNLYAEAYAGCPNMASDTIRCANISQAPFVLPISGRSPGELIYFRLWDSLNIQLGLGIGAAEISAHELPADPADWELCDYKVSSEYAGDGTGLRKANELMIQYEIGVSDAERATLRMEAGVTDFDECKCGKAPIELWSASDPIELENRRKRASASSTVANDTTNHNYLLDVIALEQKLEEESIRVSNNLSEEFKPVVGMDALGNYIIVWAEYNDTGTHKHIKARRYNAYGIPNGSAFTVNSTLGNMSSPNVSMNASGAFSIVWYDAILEDVWMKKYDSQGQALLEILIENDRVATPDIGLADDGSYIIAYERSYTPSLEHDIEWRKYNSSDVLIKLGVVYLSLQALPLEPEVVIASNGDFIITWTDPTGVDTGAIGVYKRAYDTAGIPKEGIIQVNTTPAGTKSSPAISIDQDNNYIIAWREDKPHFQRYSKLDIPIGGEQTISFTGAINPEVDMDESGDFVLSWSEDGTGIIHAQYYNSAATPFGGIIQVSTLSMGNDFPRLQINDTGNVVVVWASDNTPTNMAVMQRRYISPSSNAPLESIILSGDITGVSPQGFAGTIYTPTPPINGYVNVATIDSGVDAGHTHFQNALWNNPASTPCLDNMDVVNTIGYDFVNATSNPEDLDLHGTAVNGRIVNDFPNDLQLELMNLKFYEQGNSSLFDAICAIYYAVEKGADVLNLSWGFESAEYPSILKDALDYALCNDVIIVTSAGNSSRDNTSINKYPSNFTAADNSIITVAAYEENIESGTSTIQLAYYSNYGANVDIAAPGYVETTDLDGGITAFVGTSLATPEVARVAAIIRARYPEFNALDVKDCLVHASSVDAYPSFNLRPGAGALNETKALAYAASKATNYTPTLIENCGVTLQVKTYLQGAYNGVDMNTNLETANLIPLIDPYGLGETVDQIPTDAVDWVHVQVLDSAYNVLAEKACFLRKDGQVLSPTGNPNVLFECLEATQGYVVIRHRNHLGVMTSSEIGF